MTDGTKQHVRVMRGTGARASFRMLGVLGLLEACGGPVTAASPPAQASSPVGLWGAEVDLVPAGELAVRVQRDGDRWTAEVVGERVACERDGEAWAAHFARGTLRLLIVEGAPHAMWLQAGRAYANEVWLVARGDAWEGAVAPIPDRLRVYVSIASDGTAFVREAERNMGLRLGRLHVETHGGELVFRDKRGQPAMRATWAGDHMTVHFTSGEPDLEVTRRDREHAPGFYPRPSGASHYAYAPPLAGDDGWPVATLDEVGLAREPIVAEVQSIVDAVPTSATSPAIHALVVARHGKLVLDEYFAGHTAADVHDLRSASKSISTTLVGMAVDHGELAPSDRVLDVLGAPPGPADPRRAHMTVEHLLTMSSGLACDDDDDASPGNEEVMQSQKAQPDWHRYMWELPMAREPGSQALYCSGTMNLLGALLVRRGHADITADFFERFARPLDIRRAAINLMPTGQAYLGGGIRLRARDFAKLAQLVVSRGQWRGHAIVSADWLARATSAHAAIHEPGDYGYGWWRTRYTVRGRSIEAVYASGNGGQLAVAIPELDMVVAIEAGNYGNFPTWRTFRDELVPRLLAAASP